MRLTIVGCSGSFAGPESAASCYLLEHNGFRLVLDIGSGSFGSLQQHAELGGVDALVLSHLHPDHCADLVGIYVAQTYHPGGPRPPLDVYGPSATPARIAELFGGLDDAAVRRAFTTYEHEPAYDVGPFRITTTRVVHPIEAYAVRVEADGASLVYSGDTAPTPALVGLSRGADLALYEAAFLTRLPHPPATHLTGREAAEHAISAGIDRLVLTHLVPWNDDDEVYAEARDIYHGDLQLARPGAIYDI